MEGLRESEKKEDANHPTAEDSSADGIRDLPKLTVEDLIQGEDPLVVVFNKLCRHLMENVSTTRALQAFQARTLKTLFDCIMSHGKILEILWEEYADQRRKHYPQAGVEPCEADWPGKKEAVVAIKGMTTRSQAKKTLGSRWVVDSDHPLKRRLDFDSSEEEHGREVTEENPGDVTPLLFEIKKDGLLSSDDMPKTTKGDEIYHNGTSRSSLNFRQRPGTGILYSGEHCHGARHGFWSLHPREEVVDDVSGYKPRRTMLNDEHHDSVWWLPTTFAQIALNPSTYCKETMAFIHHKYMKYVDETAKIYIPLNKDQHRYLMVVDLCEKALIYLDSAKDIDAREGRMDQMEYVAFFLLRLLKDRKFYRKKESKCPERLDCGVWVTQWMQLSELWTSYDLEIVNDTHRMQLAVDLVMSRANPIRSKICQRAVEYWDNTVRGSGQKPQKASKTNPQRHRR
ncbi:Ulp1 protease family, carboxy-terminal domain protein [Arachis hypogaea]|nr:Ulp1 protease family, carboxy-terminal domain protein [Arachis hypogaea]